MNSHVDFGYPWWLSYGRLPVLAGAAAIFVLGYMRSWSKWLMVLLGLVVLWSGAGFLITRFAFNANGYARCRPRVFCVLVRAGSLISERVQADRRLWSS